jgi:hypothetical protein
VKTVRVEEVRVELSHFIPRACPRCQKPLERVKESQVELGFGNLHQVRICPNGHWTFYDSRPPGNEFVVATTEKAPSKAVVASIIIIISTPPATPPAEEKNPAIIMESRRTSQPLPRTPRKSKPQTGRGK